MKFLIDANLSPRVADRLREAGHDATHVNDVGLITADDDVILARASEAGEVIVTADADFGTLLALRNETRPSVVLLRSADHLAPDDQSTLVLTSLEHAQEELESGAVASGTPQRVRIRSLPMDAG